MSSANDIQIKGNGNRDLVSTLNKKVSIDKNTKNNEENNQNVKNEKNNSCKPTQILLIVLGVIIGVLLVGAAIAIPIIQRIKKKKEEVIAPTDETEKIEETEGKVRQDIFGEINGSNYIRTEAYEDFFISYDGSLRVVGEDFQHKESVYILSKDNVKFIIDNNGTIKDVNKNDFPLYYSFNESITNGSYLFKGVKCFKIIDLSKMDSSEMIDASNMFENSNFEEIYFWTENESSIVNSEYIIEGETETRLENSVNSAGIRNLNESLDNNGEIIEDPENAQSTKHFDTAKIKRASEIFMNCKNLKKIQLPPVFNVGKNAKGMFKGCSKLEEVNTSLIISNEVEEMQSMFEDCQSLKEISFSNNFLTGEIKSLINVFRNTNLMSLDISYLRLFSLETFTNVLDGASIKGTLKIGKYYPNENIRDDLLRAIAKVTDSITNVFTPIGTDINQIFQNIYYSEKNETISVISINIDYNIIYKEDKKYKLYSNDLHIGLGWEYDESNIYDLDSSILTFNANLNWLDKVNYQKLTTYNGAIKLNGDDTTGIGDGDDEEINILLNLLPSYVKIFTVQLNSYRRNSLKNVKSAYIRLSSQSDIIGTYSIDKAGDNIGLLIGYFSKSESNAWYFKPSNKVIPGHIVTESIDSIQEILRNDSSISNEVNEDVYLQTSRKIGNHLHWCGDPHIPQREGWDCPLNDSDTNKCWFCKYGCAVSSYLHFTGEVPNEENIKKCVNSNADMDWGKFGYYYGNSYHDNCFGKIIKSDGSTHFVHIMRIYEDGTCDIFDPNGGRRVGNINEFNSFLVKNIHS